jgi:glycosyltransferase involved in cell wall biosynthesis
MRILHIIPAYKPSFCYGGPVESVSRLCEGLVEAGHKIDVYTTTANGKTKLDMPHKQAVDVNGVNVTYFHAWTDDPSHVTPSLWRKLMRSCREYDAIHIHSWWNILVLISAWICHYKGVRVVVSPRGMLTSYIFQSGKVWVKRLIHQFGGSSLLKKALLHATAPAEYKECQELIPKWNGFVLPNILDLPDRAFSKRGNKVFTLIFLSRIHPKKGIELLFHALCDVPFEIHLRIAGSGDDRYVEVLKKLAEEVGVVEKIQWLGWLDRESKYRELAASDVFILPSYNENFANVVIESLQVGTPVIITSEVGLAPFVTENDLGWITSLEVSSIRNAIVSAYFDEEKRGRVAKDGRKAIDDTFAQAALIQEYIKQYRKLIEVIEPRNSRVENVEKKIV